jgi:hypothetical protein
LEARWFENYWQGGKMWRSAGHIGGNGLPTAAWFSFRKRVCEMSVAKRRPLPKKQYGLAESSYYNGRVMGYVESRKLVYVPVYRRLIERLPIIAKLKALVQSGQNIMIIDNDGPPKHLHPNGLELTPQNWQTMIDNPLHPFGHGYVVAAILANLDTSPPPITTPTPTSLAVPPSAATSTTPISTASHTLSNSNSNSNSNNNSTSSSSSSISDGGAILASTKSRKRAHEGGEGGQAKRAKSGQLEFCQ